MVPPTGFNIKTYDIDYKHLNFIQFCIMPPIMPPFYFVTHKLRNLDFSFSKTTCIAKISSIAFIVANNEIFHRAQLIFYAQ